MNRGMIVADIWSRYKLEVLGLGISLAVLLLSAWGQLGVANADEKSVIVSSPISKPSTDDLMYVDIQGAVNKPGVYKLSNSARLGELLEKAQGLSLQADTAYFHQQFNLAQKLKDQDKVYVPTSNETAQRSVSPVPAASATSTLVNVNSATLKELDALPGIGQVTAEAIIAGRPYLRLEELTERNVIKQSVFADIVGLISVN